MLLICRRDRQESIVVGHLKSPAYRNKISFKLGYPAVNARKYVRCARTFYFSLPPPTIQIKGSSLRKRIKQFYRLKSS